MNSERTQHDYSDVKEYERNGEVKHHHRGKSSERFLDKSAIMESL